MKDYTIADIEIMTEEDASAIALEKLDVKGHTIYMVDFGGYFGYSCMVFLNGHHIYHANDYALHHAGKTQDELRTLYLERMKNILFTPEEIAAPLSDYTDYNRRFRYLMDYYGMQEDRISMFNVGCTKREHMELFKRLEAARDAMNDNFDYWKSAFKYEMANHEYAINWQADWDTLSAFGNIYYHGDDDDEVEQYFNELHFTETQRKAYWAARREYLKEVNYY